MKLSKPTWVHHDEKPIFSLDVHQDCLKFATGGQGVDSGLVVIWNLLPVISEKAESDKTIPKMLCQMDNHLACVNCVRWSQNGQMLASASDDKLVMIWKKAKGPSGVFGTGGIQKNPETWKCAFTLRGHSGDVLDLAWSPQDTWLASCSIDNTIIIWDVATFPNMIAMLKGHSGLVKGVAWDPVGKFLASQSDDRSVKIWKTSDWTCSSTITDPFEECGGTTHILRLSWSPDGQYLVSAHAMNGGGPTAQIVERDGWKCDKDFVGHRKAVTCVRFHTSILKRQTAKSNKPQQYCCLAVGSRDRSLSVWMTALQRPLVVIHELFNDSILDLSWGAEKCILMACSGDGTVACLQFSQTEIGSPLSEDDKNGLYQRIYGKNATFDKNSTCVTDMLIENPELLTVLPEKLKQPTLPTFHIAPISNGTNSIDTNFLSQSINGFGSSNECEKVDFIVPSTTPVQVINKQLETRTADGKRRITPVFIPPNQELSDPLQVLSTAHTDDPIVNRIGDTDLKTTLCEDAKSNLSDTEQPISTEVGQLSRLDSRLIKCTTSTDILPPRRLDKEVIKGFPYQKSKTILSNELNQASTTGPKINITNNTVCEFQKTALDYRVHVHNGNIQTPTGMLSKVTAYSLNLGNKLWQVYVGSPVVNLNFCTKYVMLCSLDGTLRLIHMQTGSGVLPVIGLSTAVIQCAFCPNGNMVGVLTECGILRIWNIEKGSVFLAASCTEIFGRFGQVIQFTITRNGVPFLLFSNGNSYSYSEKLKSWLVLNTKDPIIRYGLQSTLPKEFNKNFNLYPLISIQSSTNSYSNLYNPVDVNGSIWQSSAKISFIENQIKLCEAINSPEELRHWYSMLTFHLAMNDSERSLRILLDDLLGSSNSTLNPCNSDNKILSITKHELLEDALNILKSNIKWQRIYMEYQDLYDSHRNHFSGIQSDYLNVEMETVPE